MFKYLLDTNICSEIIKNPNGKVASRLFHVGEHHACINWVVEAELKVGAKLKGNLKLTQRVQTFLNEFDVLPFNQGKLVDSYINIRTDLTKRGELIGQNDLWIASHAMAEGLTLVTHNTKEFKRINALNVVDWVE